MFFLRRHRVEKVDWKISEQTRVIVQEYAQYLDATPEHVVDVFLKNLLADTDFADYLRGKRNYKRIVNKVFFGDVDMKLLDLCQKEDLMGFTMFKPSEAIKAASEMGPFEEETDISEEEPRSGAV